MIHEDRIDQETNLRVNEKSGLVENIGVGIVPQRNEKIIEAKGNWMFPGLIDLHVHLRDFGQAYKEDYFTGVQSALAGGYTSIFDMPNKIPPINDYSTYLRVKKRIDQISEIDIYQYIMITDKMLKEKGKEQDYWKYGKIYFGGSTAALGQEYSILEQLEGLSNKFISIHAEDSEIIKNCMLKKNLDPVRDHNKVRPPEAEFTALKNALSIIKKCATLTKFHFAHVSLPESISLIGSCNLANVSFEAAPHHLFLSEDDLSHLGVFGKVNPPLRDKKSMKMLRKLWVEGKIPVLASDHAPHTREEKIKEIPSGIPSLDTNFRMLLDFCIKHSISPCLLTRTMSTTPAKISGLNDRGSIIKGKKADLVLVDPNREEKLTKSTLYTKCQWTPWEEQKLTGIPLLTLKNGKIVWSNPHK